MKSYTRKLKTETLIGLPVEEFKKLTDLPAESALPPLAKSDFKASNPKDVFGLAKPSLSVLSGPYILEMLAEFRRTAPGESPNMAYLYGVGMAMSEGAFKYARHNYRVVGVLGSVYVDAGLRHGSSHICGELIDPDSGLPHAVKLGACCAVLYDGICLGNWVDDRPPRIVTPLLRAYSFIPSATNPSAENRLWHMHAAAECLTRWWEGGNHELLINASRFAADAFSAAFPAFKDAPSKWLKIWADDLKRLSDKYPEKKAPYTQKRVNEENALKRMKVGEKVGPADP